VFLRPLPRQSAFPEGKVDSPLAAKTEEGLPGTRRAASLVQREVAFLKEMTEGL